LFEKINSSESFIVFSASGNENKRGVTSFVLEFSDKSGDLFESVVDESDIVGSVDNFLFDKFSVSNGSIVDTSVGVHDGSEVTNSASKLCFSFVMGNIKCSSLIEGRLSETVKNIHNGINSITSLFFQFHELSEFW